MPPEPIKDRPYLQLAGLLAGFVATGVGAWFIPGDDLHRRATLVALSVGVLFDLLSAFYHVMTMVTGKFMSGLPFAPLFYAWFLLASRFPLVSPLEADLGRVLPLKLADLAVLAALHVLCQLPAGFQKPRSEYE